jgi:hypothetical protein
MRTIVTLSGFHLCGLSFTNSCLGLLRSLRSLATTCIWPIYICCLLRDCEAPLRRMDLRVCFDTARRGFTRISESESGIGEADGFAELKVLKEILKRKLFQKFPLKSPKAKNSIIPCMVRPVAVVDDFLDFGGEGFRARRPDKRFYRIVEAVESQLEHREHFRNDAA